MFRGNFSQTDIQVTQNNYNFTFLGKCYYRLKIVSKRNSDISVVGEYKNKQAGIIFLFL